MKYLCLIACLILCQEAFGQSTQLTEKAKESILLRNASAISPYLSPQFELQINETHFSSADGNPLNRFQQFLNRYPCTSIQLHHNGSKQIDGNYHSQNESFSIIFQLSEKKVRKITIIKK